MRTLHIVSHTHWDREWYLPFQEFRFRLVSLMDGLLDLLERDPGYRSFLLDGQTIVLDDYLEIRPEREAQIRQLVQDGRLLIGPWYVLPDEFLEGPEALIRNALMGRRGCRRFVADQKPMERIGYLPDPFGHISQLPQIAAKLGMDALCFWRGVGEAPTEFCWVAPDGTERLVLHLRTGYGNAAKLAAGEDGFIRDLAYQRDVLSPHASTSHLLFMHGTDHMAPRPDLASRLEAADGALAERVVHSTLPSYLSAVQAELGDDGLRALPRRRGEMRSPQTAHLLPAVLSARTWIKQWNHRSETLLTRWAEPFSALAEQVAGEMGLRGFLRQAWTWLLKNHPHDSICGCSVDQVHSEMRARFAWAEQIAEQVTQTSLDTLARHVGSPVAGNSCVAAQEDGTGSGHRLPQTSRILVFNPLPAPSSDRVQVYVPALPEVGWVIVDDNGRPIPSRILERVTKEHFNELMDREKLLGVLAQIAAGSGPSLGELSFQRLDTRAEAGTAHLDLIVVSGPGSADRAAVIQEGLERVQALLADDQIHQFRVRVVEDAGARLEFVAREVPSVGYAPYALVGSNRKEANQEMPTASTRAANTIENEFFTVQADPADGTVTITDTTTGFIIQGANHFVDSGDRGDEYTYTPPEHDVTIDRPATVPSISSEDDGIGQCLVINLVYRIPSALRLDDRSRRSDDLIDLPITTRITLTRGVRRIDFETSVKNLAEDHRLRVHFPTSISTDRSWAEGHFDVIERPLKLATDTESWAEQPVGTHPQLTFADLSDGLHGVMLANRGLPEYEALPGSDGSPGVTLALTLLRCVGWLSRGDLHNRTGHAGPAVTTPEAQCLGAHCFDYALIPHAGCYGSALHEAHCFSAGLRAVCTASLDGPLPHGGSFLRVSPAAAVLSALKLPDDGDGLVVRVYNSASVPIQASLEFWRPFQQATLVPLHEQGAVCTLAQESNTVTLSLKAKEIATILLTG